MKKNLRVLIVAVAFVLATFLVGCSNGTDAKTTVPVVEEKTVLTVGFDQGYPPYGFIGDDGQFTGFDLELAKAVCDKIGLELKLQPIDWDAKDALLGSGSINCIWNGFTMEGREGKYTFAEPYMYNEQVVVVKKDSDIKSLEGLAGKTVMTQVGSAALDVLENSEERAALTATFKDLQTIGDYNNAFMQLESGMVDAVACDLSIAAYQMAAKPDTYVVLEPLSTEHYTVGFKLGDEGLAQQVTTALKELNADGTVKQLCEKYAEYGITYDNWVLV